MEWIGHAAGTLTVITMVPQVFKSIRTKNVEGVSKIMVIVFFVAMVLWVIYGILIKDLPLIIFNGFASLIALFQVCITFKYGK